MSNQPTLVTQQEMLESAIAFSMRLPGWPKALDGLIHAQASGSEESTSVQWTVNVYRVNPDKFMDLRNKDTMLRSPSNEFMWTPTGDEEVKSSFLPTEDPQNMSESGLLVRWPVPAVGLLDACDWIYSFLFPISKSRLEWKVKLP